jgi:hypothetical protein
MRIWHSKHRDGIWFGKYNKSHPLLILDYRFIKSTTHHEGEMGGKIGQLEILYKQYRDCMQLD